MLPAILCLALLPTLCLSSGSVDVYLYPHAPSPSPSQSNGLAFLMYHLGLEAYSIPIHDSIGQVQLGAARPFVGEGRRDTLLVSVDVNHPSDVMPQALQPSFALPLSIGSTSSLIQRYINYSLKTYHLVADSTTTPSQHQSLRILDIFAISSVSSPSKSEAIWKFLESLKNLVAYVEESQQSGNAGRFGAFELNGLKDIEEEWGQESEQYLTATATLKATIQSAVANELSLAVLIPSPLKTRQVIQPSQPPFPPKKIPATAPVFSTSTCFTSAGMCRNATATCSSRGDCVGVTRAGRTCFVCECRKAPLEDGGKSISWAGNMCQKKDISQQFTLIVGTVIFLVLISVGSISLLYTIGSQELPGTLIGGIGGLSKRE